MTLLREYLLYEEANNADFSSFLISNHDDFNIVGFKESSDGYIFRNTFIFFDKDNCVCVSIGNILNITTLEERIAILEEINKFNNLNIGYTVYFGANNELIFRKLVQNIENVAEFLANVIEIKSKSVLFNEYLKENNLI